MHIGISGWVYPPWRGVFYPEALSPKKELHYASRKVSSIEINGSFYHNQTPSTYQKWFAETPDDFVFSVKCPRYISHMRRLNEVETPLANFFASGVLFLEHKLGAFLWQFPPSFRYDEEKLDHFFRLLPRTFAEAALMAKESDRLEVDYPEEIRKSHGPLRYAMEIRNPSFENPYFIELLRKHGIALVFADTAGRWPYMEDVTADFLYLRLHGDEELYKSGYDDSTLRWWADRIRLWTKGRKPKDSLNLLDEVAPKKERDVYVYFDNDIKVRAPHDAQVLMKMLKVPPPRAELS